MRRWLASVSLEITIASNSVAELCLAYSHQTPSAQGEVTRVDASHRIKSVAVMPAKMVPVNLIAKSAASVPPAFTSVFDVYLAHCFDGTPPTDPDGYQDVDPVFPTLQSSGKGARHH